MARGKLEATLLRALKTAPVQPSDAAAVEATRLYAAQIDAHPAMLVQLGRGFKEMLVELAMTPKARAAVLKEAPEQPAVPSALDELRARREQRASS